MSSAAAAAAAAAALQKAGVSAPANGALVRAAQQQEPLADRDKVVEVRVVIKALQNQIASLQAQLATVEEAEGELKGGLKQQSRLLVRTAREKGMLEVGLGRYVRPSEDDPSPGPNPEAVRLREHLLEMQSRASEAARTKARLQEDVDKCRSLLRHGEAERADAAAQSEAQMAALQRKLQERRAARARAEEESRARSAAAQRAAEEFRSRAAAAWRDGHQAAQARKQTEAKVDAAEQERRLYDVRAAALTRPATHGTEGRVPAASPAHDREQASRPSSKTATGLGAKADSTPQGSAASSAPAHREGAAPGYNRGAGGPEPPRSERGSDSVRVPTHNAQPEDAASSARNSAHASSVPAGAPGGNSASSAKRSAGPLDRGTQPDDGASKVGSVSSVTGSTAAGGSAAGGSAIASVSVSATTRSGALKASSRKGGEGASDMSF